MEPTSSLVVAMMFITLLAMGLGNLLMQLASTVQGVRPHAQGLVLFWELVLVVMHYHLFWNAVEILKLEHWSFGDFVFVQTGPALLLIANHLIGQAPPSEGSQSGYEAASRRFFAILGLAQLWMVGLDWLWESWSLVTWLNLSIAVLVAVLTIVRVPRMHQAGAALVALLLSAAIWADENQSSDEERSDAQSESVVKVTSTDTVGSVSRSARKTA